MRVGIDFDNTIVCYDQLFWRLARERHWVAPHVLPTKHAVRNALREAGMESQWVKLQALVYGTAIAGAEPYKGVLDVLAGWRGAGIEVAVVSHKTQHPPRDPQVDLHQAAWVWLQHNRIITGSTPLLPVSAIHFELTREAKLDRIRQLRCEWFIDDLPEFLLEPQFPASTKRLLFDPHRVHCADLRYRRACFWNQVNEHVTAQQRVAG